MGWVVDDNYELGPRELRYHLDALFRHHLHNTFQHLRLLGDWWIGVLDLPAERLLQKRTTRHWAVLYSLAPGDGNIRPYPKLLRRPGQYLYPGLRRLSSYHSATTIHPRRQDWLRDRLEEGSTFRIT